MIRIKDIARVCYEANRALQVVQGSPYPNVGWMLTHHAQREAAIEQVKAVIEGRSAEQVHQAWMDDQIADGWTHGAEVSGLAKTHPCLVPYDDLGSDQKVRDRVFSQIVMTMTGDPSFTGE